MASSVLTARMDTEKKEKMKRILKKNGMTFNSFVNYQADLLIDNNGFDFVVQPDEGKTEQEKMLERMSRPENREKIKTFYTRMRELQVHRPLSKFDTMSKAEIAIEKAKVRGVI